MELLVYSSGLVKVGVLLVLLKSAGLNGVNSLSEFIDPFVVCCTVREGHSVAVLSRSCGLCI